MSEPVVRSIETVTHGRFLIRPPAAGEPPAMSGSPSPLLISIADALDAERKSKGARGPLHGIPVFLKDNIGTADRMTTTAGSLALEGSRPARDAHMARRLRSRSRT